MYCSAVLSHSSEGIVIWSVVALPSINMINGDYVDIISERYSVSSTNFIPLSNHYIKMD
jgi:hypothetical protein